MEPCSTDSPAAGCCWRTLLPKNLVESTFRPAASRAAVASPSLMPVTSGTVTRGTPADTVIVTVLPNATGPSPGPGVTAMTSPVSTAALRPSSTLLHREAEGLEVGHGLFGGLTRDVGDVDRLVARC